jgi:hypothetical protein
MPTPKKKPDPETAIETAPVAAPVVSIESRFVPKATLVVEEMTRDLARMRVDLRTTTDEQARLEKANLDVPPELLKSRHTLERGIEDAETALVNLCLAQAIENYDRDRAAWHDLQRQRALTVLALRQINKAIETKKSSYRVQGQLSPLPCDGHMHRLFGSRKAPGISGLGAQEYLSQCVVEGFLSRKELTADD